MNSMVISNIHHYFYLLRAVGLRIGQVRDGIMVKHGKLKYEVNSYT